MTTHQIDHPQAATLSRMLEVADEAGRLLLQLQSRRLELAVTNKASSGARDLVTAADLAVDALLAERLAAVAAIPYVSEESELKDRVGDMPGPFWLADPIDGTNNFINGMPMYGCAFALVEEGRAIAAVSAFPALGETFYALRGGGAWCGKRRLAVSDKPNDDWVVEVSSQPDDAELLRNAMAMLSGTRAARILGSIALSLCWVAGGELDLFLGRGHAWDVAGGMLMLEEVGAVCRTLDGQARNPMVKQMMVAGPSAHVDHALARIKRL